MAGVQCRHIPQLPIQGQPFTPVGGVGWQGQSAGFYSKVGKLECVLTLFFTASPSNFTLGLVAERVMLVNWAGSRPGFAANRLCHVRTVNPSSEPLICAKKH